MKRGTGVPPVFTRKMRVPHSILFISQRVDRIEGRGFTRGVVAKEYSHGD